MSNSWTDHELELLWIYITLSNNHNSAILAIDSELAEDFCFIEAQLSIINKYIVYYNDHHEPELYSFKEFQNMLQNFISLDEFRFHPINFNSLDLYKHYQYRMLYDCIIRTDLASHSGSKACK